MDIWWNAKRNFMIAAGDLCGNFRGLFVKIYGKYIFVDKRTSYRNTITGYSKL